MLRIVGTFIGCIAALVIIITMIRAHVINAAGVRYLGRVLYLGIVAGAGRRTPTPGGCPATALIIVVTIQAEPLLTPRFAVERCGGCARDYLRDRCRSCCSLRARSKKRSITNSTPCLSINTAWCSCASEALAIAMKWTMRLALGRRTAALEGMRSNLNMESSRWARAKPPSKSAEYRFADYDYQAQTIPIIQNSRPEIITDAYRELFEEAG
jgi:p-hydroxybenzoic acid efflux pump subunit AaeB